MDLECRKDRTSDLLASSSQAWLNSKHSICRATEDFLNALASLWVREAPLLIVLIRAAAHRGHWALENSFSISGSRRAGCLQGLSLRHPADALNSPPLPLLIKLLGSNYNAVTSLAEISALHILEGTHAAHQRPWNQSSVQCLLPRRRWSFRITESAENTNLACFEYVRGRLADGCVSCLDSFTKISLKWE